MILLCVVLLLVGGEIALRILCDFDSRFNIFLAAHSQFDPYLKFRLTPNYKSEDIRINSKGILGPEFEARKAPGSYRILTVGDSCTFVPAKRPYPRALEDELRRRHPDRRIDVINGSCPGYDSGQARTWYERELDGYDHDLLIIYVGWNDMGQYNPNGLAYKLDQTGYLKQPTLIQSAFLHCYLLRSLYLVQGYWQRSRPFDAGPLTPQDLKLYEDFYPTHYEKNMTRIVQLAQSRHRDVRLLNFASIVTENPTEDEQRRMHFPRGMGRKLRKFLLLKKAYEKALHNVADRTATPIIDIESIFPDPASRAVFTDAMHFTVDGAERIGKQVGQAVSPLIK